MFYDNIFRKQIISEMENFLIIKQVRDIADNISGKEKCTCPEHVDKSTELCSYCEANGLIAKLDKILGKRTWNKI